MKTALFFAWRYIFSSKSHNIINRITWITIISVAIISCAMVIILSVFNGLSSTIIAQYNKFDAELKIEPTQGKTFKLDPITMSRLRSIKGVAHSFENIEQEVLLTNAGQQYIATIKGVDKDYIQVSHLKDAIIDGQYNVSDTSFSLFGAGVAYYLALTVNNYRDPVSIYTPRRGNFDIYNPANSFNMTMLVPSAIFSLQQAFDVKYIVIPIAQSRTLLDYDSNETSFIGIYLDPQASVNQVKRKIKNILGDNFTVKDRFEQQEMLYKIMKSEKWAVFLILSFILAIAGFNIVSSMTMLIIDKKHDIFVLKSMGFTTALVRKIFFLEGLIITALGTLSGITLGVAVCYIQKIFKIIKIQGDGTFIIDAYPVVISPYDLTYIFLTIMSIGTILVFYSIIRLKKYNILSSLK